MEIFDDRWGPLGDRSRSLTQAELTQWWVTLVATPTITAFQAQELNPSWIGTDLQLLSGDHPISRGWALRMMRHPANVGGILYRSRHDDTQHNLALFHSPGLDPPVMHVTLQPPAARHGHGPAKANGPLVYGQPILLRDHPQLQAVLKSLEVAVLP